MNLSHKGSTYDADRFLQVGVGNYNTVHGWNANYQDIPANLNPPRFHAFNMNPAGRPVQFHNLPVAVVPPPANGILDHQGHIVPQNVLDIALAPAMNAAFQANPRPTTIPELHAFLIANYPAINWAAVTTYINWLIGQNNGCHAGYFVDPDGGNAEDWYGGYFSVMMWNPVNICRAPDDAHRGGVPGNAVDLQVIAYITANPAQAGITLLPGMVAAFAAVALWPIPGPPGLANVVAFINACNASLLHQQGGTAGYYMFNWQPNGLGALIPGP